MSPATPCNALSCEKINTPKYKNTLQTTILFTSPTLTVHVLLIMCSARVLLRVLILWTWEKASPTTQKKKSTKKRATKRECTESTANDYTHNTEYMKHSKTNGHLNIYFCLNSDYICISIYVGLTHRTCSHEYKSHTAGMIKVEREWLVCISFTWGPGY